ncbi:MAG: oligosaccharide flippase family protein [Gemmatimonadales bacterium]
MTDPRPTRPAGLASGELGRRTIASGLAAVLARIVHSGLLLGASMVLARLLTPADFGVFAMAVPLGALGTAFANHSFQTVILQRPDTRPADVDSLFWFAAQVNLLVAGIMVAVGWGLAQWYGEPRLVPVVAGWAIAIYFLTLTGFQEALLKRALRFPAVLLVQLVGVAVSVVASIWAAVHGAGHWALLIQILVMEGCRAVGIHWLGGWRPRRPVDADPTAVASMRRSWRALNGLRMATWINDQPDLVAVARMGDATVLGLYDTARRWTRYPFEEPFFSVTEVAVASLSQLRGDHDRFRRFVTRGFRAILTITLPVVALVGAEAPSVVRVLLGPQWGSAAPFARLLAVAAFAAAVARVTEWIALAQGRSERLLRWSLIVRAPILVAAVLLGSRHGALGVALALAVVEVALAGITIIYNVRHSGLAVGEVFQAIARPLIASLLAVAALTWLGGALPGEPGGARLALALLIHSAVYVTAWVGLPGGIAAARETIAALRERGPAVVK